MRKAIIIVLSMSLCIFAEAQKALEWEVKAGTYVEVFKLPYFGRSIARVKTDTKSYATFSLGVFIKKWNILLQLNGDTHLAIFGGISSWSPSYYKANYPRDSTVIAYVYEGDTIEIVNHHTNIISGLYRFINTQASRF